MAMDVNRASFLEFMKLNFHSGRLEREKPSRSIHQLLHSESNQRNFLETLSVAWLVFVQSC